MGNSVQCVMTAVVSVGATLVGAPPVEAANSIVTLDSDGVVNETSVVLDASFNPVVAYNAVGELKLVHCNDAQCAGSDESIVTVDSDGDVGATASLVLDAAGRPVISYYDSTNGHLKVAHCDDLNCAGGGDSVVAVDRSGTVGPFTSLQLDAAGNPVVSYHDYGTFDLKVAHCDDPNCAGGGESIVAVDTAGGVGSDTSLELDAAGNPVVASYDFENGDLKFVHCNDPDCTGGDESIVTVDSAEDVGAYTALELDATGNPVISYFDRSHRDLKLVRCTDPDCAGDDESIVTVDSAGEVGAHTSLDLDPAGLPVVSYQDMTNGDLKVAYCNDANCAGADESINVVDDAGDVGDSTSLRLDHGGRPVISYRAGSEEDLKLAHCDNAICAPATCGGLGATIVGTDGNDVINGTAGADFIAGGGGDDTINGLAGADVVCGGDGRDTIHGGDGNDHILGFSDGDNRDVGDTLHGDAGADFIDGGPGNDVLAGGPGDDALSGEGGVDTVTFAASAAGVSANLATESATGEGVDVLFGFENMTGSPFGDTLVGDGGANTIQGLDGDDGLDGAAGVDTVSYAASDLNVSVNLTTRSATGDGTDRLAGFENVVGSRFGDTLIGNGSANTLRGLDGIDGLDGAAGADRVDGADGDDILFGSPGNDMFTGGVGSDTLNFARSPAGVNADLSAGIVVGEGSDRITGIEHLGGSEFADRLTGNAGSNSIAGGPGNDVIVGGGGADTMFADEGADRIDAGTGDDLVDAGTGNDVVAGGPGDDHVSGEAGVDTVTYAEAAAGVAVSLQTTRATGDGSDLLFELERIIGTRFADVLVGNGRGNRIGGGNGADRLAGVGGNDVLDGGSGSDGLDCGAGFDRGNGGLGSDTQRRCEVTARIP